MTILKSRSDEIDMIYWLSRKKILIGFNSYQGKSKGEPLVMVERYYDRFLDNEVCWWTVWRVLCSPMNGWRCWGFPWRSSRLFHHRQMKRKGVFMSDKTGFIHYHDLLTRYAPIYPMLHSPTPIIHNFHYWPWRCFLIIVVATTASSLRGFKLVYSPHNPSLSQISMTNISIVKRNFTYSFFCTSASTEVNKGVVVNGSRFLGILVLMGCCLSRQNEASVDCGTLWSLWKPVEVHGSLYDEGLRIAHPILALSPF